MWWLDSLSGRNGRRYKWSSLRRLLWHLPVQAQSLFYDEHLKLGLHRNISDELTANITKSSSYFCLLTFCTFFLRSCHCYSTIMCSWTLNTQAFCLYDTCACQSGFPQAVFNMLIVCMIRSFYTVQSDTWFAVWTRVESWTCYCDGVTRPLTSINTEAGLLWTCYNSQKH